MFHSYDTNYHIVKTSDLEHPMSSHYQDPHVQPIPAWLMYQVVTAYLSPMTARASPCTMCLPLKEPQIYGSATNFDLCCVHDPQKNAMPSHIYIYIHA